MAGSVGGALAEGIERGMGLGFQIQDRERQAALDKRRQEDADRQFGLDQQRYDQQMARQTAADDRATQAERRKLLDDEHTELVSTIQGMQQAGQQVPPSWRSASRRTPPRAASTGTRCCARPWPLNGSSTSTPSPAFSPARLIPQPCRAPICTGA